MRLKAIEDLHREISTEIRAIKESGKCCRDAFNKVSGDIKTLREEAQKLTRIIQELQLEHNKVSQRVEELEQHTRARNVQIKAVPVPKIIKNHWQPDTLTSESYIDICHSVQTPSHENKNIIVIFVRRCKRNALQKMLEQEEIIANDLELSAPGAVYINEHLTLQNKQLMGSVIAKKKVNWRYF